MKSRHTQFALCIFHPLQVDNREWGVLDLELGFTLPINNFFILTAIHQTEIKKCFFSEDVLSIDLVVLCETISE